MPRGPKGERRAPLAHPSSRANGHRAALQGNPSALARDSSAFERVNFLNERQAMTRTFSDIDDIGGTAEKFAKLDFNCD
jgi:hypothetical protein